MRLFFVLLAVWLILNQSFAPGHVLLGAALALGGVAWYAVTVPLTDRLASRSAAAAAAGRTSMYVAPLTSNAAMANFVSRFMTDLRFRALDSTSA